MNESHKDGRSEAKDLFMKLNSWKEESQREFSTFMFNTYAEFSNIISSQSPIIDQGIDNLLEEVSDLKAQLSIMTQERNDLNETVENLSCRNRKLSDKLEENLSKNIQEIGGSAVHNPETKEEEEHLNYGKISNKTVQQPKKIPSSEQNNWEVNDIEHVSLGEEVPEDVEQEEREEIHENIEGYDEKKTNDVSEQLVQFEDTQGNLHTLIRPVVNKGRRKHTCENCPYTSTSRSHLKEHVENVHEKIRRHFCKECDYASYRKRGLTHHIKMVHEKSINVCEDCGYAETRKALLNSHRASVHGIRI